MPNESLWAEYAPVHSSVRQMSRIGYIRPSPSIAGHDRFPFGNGRYIGPGRLLLVSSAMTCRRSSGAHYLSVWTPSSHLNFFVRRRGSLRETNSSVSVEGQDRGRSFFATNLPQGNSEGFREWRISAGYSGPKFCGKNGPEGSFVSVVSA